MQFIGHSLPVHQSMSVSWAFTLSHFVSQICLHDFFRLLAIGMCHFLPVHHFGMACLAGSKVNIQHNQKHKKSNFVQILGSKKAENYYNKPNFWFLPKIQKPKLIHFSIPKSYKYVKTFLPGSSAVIFYWNLWQSTCWTQKTINERIKFQLITVKYQASHFGLLKLTKYPPFANIQLSVSTHLYINECKNVWLQLQLKLFSLLPCS